MPDPRSTTLEIIVNGEKREAPEGQTLLTFLKSLGLDESRIAVELDGLIVSKNAWTSTILHPGARLEIVQFVGGG
jgi:thiamine biosynthesis protein ThiS